MIKKNEKLKLMALAVLTLSGASKADNVSFYGAIDAGVPPMSG
ncbi:hypothetical protein ACO0K0_14485 [Undibacterium sp. SXout11W]